MKAFWDERFEGAAYAYGTEPNDFLVTASRHLKPKSHVLSIGEGEGRNAVFLSKHGHHLTAIDQSVNGLAKAKKLAEQAGCSLETVAADLAHYEFKKNSYDGVVCIFCHLPKAIRKRVYEQICLTLRSGGIFILECYSPEQLSYNTGDPKEKDMLVPLDELVAAFQSFEILHAKSLSRHIVEGTFHTGMAAVTQYVGRKP